MEVKQRKEAFVRLGEWFRTLATQPESCPEALEVMRREQHYNGWFTFENIKASMAAWADALTAEKLDAFVARYDLPAKPTGKRIGIVMAGNIPLVGFHDLMCVLLAGHTAVIKLSRDDQRLPLLVLEQLKKIAPEMLPHIILAAVKLEDFDAVIATGSNNTARYFEHYFGKYPNIIRKSRTSVAILTGGESDRELEHLADDVFMYFGLGCRNVTKIFLPEGFDLNRLFAAFYNYRQLTEHNKYSNNYDYHKALWLLNGDELLENGFLLVKEDPGLVSPVGAVFYERYSDLASAEAIVVERSEEIQCVVGRGHIEFGKAQQPELWDYADDVDTMQFLISI